MVIGDAVQLLEYLDLDWLRARVVAHPDALLREHSAAFAEERGITVSISCVQNGMDAIGFTHKKKEVIAKERDAEHVQRKHAGGCHGSVFAAVFA